MPTKSRPSKNRAAWRPLSDLARLAVALFVTIHFAVRCSSAADEPKLKVEIVAGELTNPCGLAVQPNTGAVFISDTSAGQVVRFSPDAPNKTTPIITGFPQAEDAKTKEQAYGIGPLGLLFVSETKLLVGEGSLEQSKDAVRVFELPSDGKPLAYDQAKQKLGPITAGEAKGAGVFFGMTFSSSAPLLVTGQGLDDKAWILRASTKADGSYDDLMPFVELNARNKIDALIGMAVNKRGFIVLGPRNLDTKAGQTENEGKDSKQRTSALVFYSSKTGNQLMALPTKLHDITGLAYSPKTSRLYAVDFAWDDPKQGALYRLDAATIEGRSTVKALKLASLDKPSALAFTPDNTLYVTVFGSIPAEPKSSKPVRPGKLIKITGDL